MSKYLSPKKRHSNRKLWILLAAVLVAVVLVIFAVVKLFDSTLPDKPNQPDNSSLNGEQNQGQNQGSNSGGNNQGNSGSQGENNQQDPPAPPAPTDDSEKIAQAEKLAKGYFYDEAIALMTGLTSAEAQAKLAEYQALKAGLVKYTGQTYHVFFHSLIIDTDLAFDDKGHPASGYNEWMTTQSEFKKMLPLFLENDFVLYDITWMCEYDEATGKVKQKDIYLPEGKKPLVISVDDVNYYDYMLGDGFAQRHCLGNRRCRKNAHRRYFLDNSLYLTNVFHRASRQEVHDLLIQLHRQAFRPILRALREYWDRHSPCRRSAG